MRVRRPTAEESDKAHADMVYQNVIDAMAHAEMLRADDTYKHLMARIAKEATQRIINSIEWHKPITPETGI